MAFQPMPMSRKSLPFDHPDWIFELKYNRFRSLPVLQNGRCDLISRNVHPFKSFTELRKTVTSPHESKTVLVSEIVRLDKHALDCRSVCCSFIGASPASSYSTY